MKKSIFIGFFFSLFLFSLSWSQLVAIKSVPVATGDQFMIFPSRTAGMGGVSLALTDTLADPFSMPARGNDLHQNILTVSPVYYRIENDNGSARTIPLTLQLNRKSWFGGFHLSGQDLDITQGNGTFPDFFGSRLKDKSILNTYAAAYFGLPRVIRGITIGGSLFYSDLEGMDGVEMLYANSSNLTQKGHFLDLRLAGQKKFEKNRILEGMILYHDFKMTHKLEELFWGEWDFGTAQTIVKKHIDHSRTQGIHLNYRQPWGTKGWMLGTMATINRKTHPKIPNYELMNIPRDPGESWAYNFGVGMARESQATIFGIDLIYEPIWSTTWADAVEDMTSRSGRPIYKGQKTIENEFLFSNSVLRFGISHGPNGRGFQLGLQAHTYRYWLDQYDYVEETRRKQTEKWTEWRLSWGWFRKFSNFELRYMGRLTTGSGQPGVELGVRDAAFMAKNDILLAPQGALTLNETSIYTHQIILVVPLDTF